MAQAPQSQPAEVPTREQIQQVRTAQHVYVLWRVQMPMAAIASDLSACVLTLLRLSKQELEDNEKLIKAILENMNAGKLQACAG